jgi:hypothetical protein
MKKIKIVWLISVVFWVMFFSENIQASTPLRELGRAPLMGVVKDRFELLEKIQEHREDITAILRMAGLTEPSKIADSIEKAVRLDKGIEETSLARGTEIIWMGWKSARAGLQLLRNKFWDGSRSMEGFLISVIYENREIKFFIPKECGNLSFLGMKNLPVPPPQSETAPAPPVSNTIINNINISEAPHYAETPYYAGPFWVNNGWFYYYEGWFYILINREYRRYYRVSPYWRGHYDRIWYEYHQRYQRPLSFQYRNWQPQRNWRPQQHWQHFPTPGFRHPSYHGTHGRRH